MKIQLDSVKTPFNLDYTLSCGQTFRWERRNDWWIGVVAHTALRIRQVKGVLEVEGSSKSVDSDFLRHYFRLDDDLLTIYSRISKDEHVKEAIGQFRGLRLIRQEPWECLISFLCATYKNIPAIRHMILTLCGRFGNRIRFENATFYAFPELQALAKASLKELRLCKLGFRARRISETANIISRSEFDLEALRKMPYETAKRRLLTLPGVGPKVSDCILLFSLDKLEAFPIDVWMKRIVLDYYSEHFTTDFMTRIGMRDSLSEREYRTIYDFGRRYFGENVGYAQEYLYHHRRCSQNRVQRF